MQNLTITVDDASPIFQYSPSSAWLSATPQENADLDFYFRNTATYTNVSQANVTFEFWGSSIQIFGSKNQNRGNFKVQIDDQVFDSLSNHSDSPTSFQQQLFEQSGLLSGKHKVVITNTQEGMFVDIDFVTWQTVMDDGDSIVRLDTIQDGSQAVVYSGSWDTNPSRVGTFFGGTGHETKQPGSSLEFTFAGAAVAIYGPADPNGAPYTVQVDNSTQQNYSFHTSRYIPQSLLFYQGNMSVGEHTVRVTHAGSDSNENNTLAIDFMNVYSPATFEIRMTAGGGGTSKSTIAAIIMGIFAGLLLFLIAMIYCINRGKKLGQFEWNIFNPDRWGFNSKTEAARRIRRADVTEGFELDGGGYAAVMTSEARTGRNESGTARSAASVTPRDDPEMGLISTHRNEAPETVSSPARPNKQRWSLSGLSVLNQPLVIPKSSMGIIGMDGATRQLILPSGQGGQRNPSAGSVSVPIPLPPGLAGTSDGVGDSRPKRQETVLSWKPEPEDSQSPPSEAPPPPPLPEIYQPESEASRLSKETLRISKVDSVSPSSDSRISRHESEESLVSEGRSSSLRVHQFGSEGSLPLRSAPELDAPLPPLPSSLERSPSSINRAELLLHRIPIIPNSPPGVQGPGVQTATETLGTVEASDMRIPTSRPSERSSTSVHMSRSRPSSFGSGSMSPRSGGERHRSTGSILGPRMRSPKTPSQNYKRGRELSESSRTEKKDGGEAL